MKQKDAMENGINMLRRIGIPIASHGGAVAPATQSE
jgi:hypothetical protein